VRIWDIPAGYLNRGSLLGEHRELHGLRNIIVEGKRGYSRHPETLRWIGALSGLSCRHALLAAEMRLRGYEDRTPLRVTVGRTAWPRTFIDRPAGQFVLLRGKYADKSGGRIPLPVDAQALWAQHKYSVMARDPEVYRSLGRSVARLRSRDALDGLAGDLVTILRQCPPEGRLRNALEHMWGYVRTHAEHDEATAIRRDADVLLATIQSLAIRHREPYLIASTALSELAIYV
jgi:hypothetical protein